MDGRSHQTLRAETSSLGFLVSLQSSVPPSSFLQPPKPQPSCPSRGRRRAYVVYGGGLARATLATALGLSWTESTVALPAGWGKGRGETPASPPAREHVRRPLLSPSSFGHLRNFFGLSINVDLFIPGQGFLGDRACPSSRQIRLVRRCVCVCVCVCVCGASETSKAPPVERPRSESLCVYRPLALCLISHLGSVDLSGGHWWFGGGGKFDISSGMA
ncbi:hypothetical protein LX36DRAFT_364104 [Colletotrichum falcatum]|nr:hypothetical protein LX36DRAFT_364104 [Colletotrichum falcatum]